MKWEMYDELEFAVKELCSECAWKEGWVAVRTTKRFDGKGMSPKVLSRLDGLEVILKPVTLIEKAKIFAFSSHGSALDLVDALGDEEGENDDYHHAEEITRSLGHDVALNEDIFEKLLPDILSNDGARLYYFGQGLADGSTDTEKMWRNFCSQLPLIDESKRNYQVVRGFLNSISKTDLDISETFLDEAISDRVLSNVYPWLQTGVEINAQGVERLKKSLEFGMAPIWQYANLAYGRVHENICDVDLCELIRLISCKPEGSEVSVKILQMRILGNLKTSALSEDIISIGQEVLLNYEFCRKDNRADRNDYELAQVIKACFTNESAKGNAKVLCDRLVKAFANYDIYFFDYPYLLKALITTQPLVFLDGFFGDDIKSDYRIEREFSQSCSISIICEEVIINWCEINPKTRYPIIASVLTPYQKSKNQDSLEWSPLAQKIIANSSDPIKVLNKFKLSLRPMSWSGSRAEIMQGRLCLISALKTYGNQLIEDWAYKEEPKFQEEIRAEFEWESKCVTDENERFE